MTIVKYKRVHPAAQPPTKAHINDACWDLYACETKAIAPLTTEMVDTGIVLDFPEGFCVDIRSRSGLAAKYSITILNSPATIDAGYRGTIKLIVHNSHKMDWFRVEVGTKLAQFKLTRLEDYEVDEVEEIDMNTQRGTAGLGSTGI